MSVSFSGLRVRSAVLFVIAFLLTAVVAGCATTKGSKSAYPMAPDVAFTYLDGTTAKISDFVGKNVVVVNFWGLRCANCIEEMPFLERLHNKYGSKGLHILGINTDGLDHTMLPKYLPQLPVKMSYPTVVDPEFTLVDGFEMMAAPLTIIIARDGTVRYRHEGYEPSIEGEYVQLIEKLLAEP